MLSIFIRFLVFFFFFFSSRRRHTRSLCDWSSDVCSSDLGPRGHVAEVDLGQRERAVANDADIEFASGDVLRSEERRVGKGVDLGGCRKIKKKRRKGEVGRDE